jgi:hypothetical protein
MIHNVLSKACLTVIELSRRNLPLRSASSLSREREWHYDTVSLMLYFRFALLRRVECLLFLNRSRLRCRQIRGTYIRVLPTSLVSQFKYEEIHRMVSQRKTGSRPTKVSIQRFIWLTPHPPFNSPLVNQARSHYLFVLPFIRLIRFGPSIRGK